MDKLERQILANRDELDRHNPDPSVWQRIQNSSRKSRTLTFKRISGWAAVILILISGAFLLYPGGRGGAILFGSTDKLPSELRETENYYTARVNSLIEEAKPILTEYPSLNRDLMTEIAKLDSLYLEIKKDLRDKVSNDEVIEALILNYRAKIRILEGMLDILNEDDMDNENNVSYEI